MLAKYINKVSDSLLSPRTNQRIERFIFLIAIVAFIAHFVAMLLSNADNANPLATLYTPFTVILLYEIYLLIYYLPTSITIYIGKQYEIIALIMIRGIFDQLANLSSSMKDTDSSAVQLLIYSFVGLLALLMLIFLFYRLSGINSTSLRTGICETKQQRSFVTVKKLLALLLFVLFIFLLVSGIIKQAGYQPYTIDSTISIVKKMNQTFFNSFFTALILTEVLLLLFTYNLTNEFSKVIRNSGFIISTILLKLSFKTDGISYLIIVLIAVGFGVAILGIYRLFKKVYL